MLIFLIEIFCSFTPCQYKIIHICRGSGLPPPKIYRAPPNGAEENVDDIDLDGPTKLMKIYDVNPNSSTVASSSVLASDPVDATLSETRADGDSARTLPAVSAEQPSYTTAEGYGADDLLLSTDVATHDHSGEGVMDPMHQNHSDDADHLLKRDICDTVAEGHSGRSVDQPSGDAVVDSSVAEQYKELDDDSNKLRRALEKLVSVPVNIPGSDAFGIVNGSDGYTLRRRLSSIDEDAQPLAPLMSDEVGSGSSIHFPSIYGARRKSVPRFTPCGSFIIPADEDIYVDLSSGLFSTDPGHVGQVQDVSALPSPPSRPFTIGDNDQSELSYFSANDSIANALALSHCVTSADSERQRSSSEISKPDSTSPTDTKVEMVDATSREVLDEIFRRTSGRCSSVILMPR